MDKTNCVAYEGEKHTIEWYFDRKGKSQSFEYFERLSNSQKRKTLILFKRMCDFGKIYDKTKFRYEGNNIYAFKPQPDRFLSFFIKGRKIIITNAYRKKSNKIPGNIKVKAIRNKEDYLLRSKKGEYYGK